MSRPKIRSLDLPTKQILYNSSVGILSGDLPSLMSIRSLEILTINRWKSVDDLLINGISTINQRVVDLISTTSRYDNGSDRQ